MITWCQSQNRTVLALGFLVAVSAGNARAQIGAVLSGAGPVNRSMAGASVAAPLSPAGAIYWNPATLSGLERSELEAGAELLYVHSRLESAVAPGAVWSGRSPLRLGGCFVEQWRAIRIADDRLRVCARRITIRLRARRLQSRGLRRELSRQFHQSRLDMPAPTGLGFGPIFSEYQVLHIVPAISCNLSDRLSVGLALNLDMANLKLDPGVIGAPDNANGDAFATYPFATHGRNAWGRASTPASIITMRSGASALCSAVRNGSIHSSLTPPTNWASPANCKAQ